MPARRPALAATALLAVGCAAGVLGVLSVRHDDRVLATAAVLLRTLALLTTWLVLRRRARWMASRTNIWTDLAPAAGVVFLSSLIDVVARATGRGVVVAEVCAVVLAVVHHLLVFRGLVHWHRVRSPLIDSGDWANGPGAMLVVVAAGNLLAGLPSASRWNGWSWWELQSWLLPLSGLVVVLGTLLTVAQFGNRLRDWRVLVMLVGGILTLVASVVIAALGVSPWVLSPMVLTAPLDILLACCALLSRETRVLPMTATNQATTVGAFVVGTAAVVVLIASTRLDPHESLTPVAVAGVALVGVGARVIVLVRDLTNLSTTRRQALTDDLTDLPNRRAVTARLGEVADGVVLVLDLDRFKEVNDRFGHAAGDSLLRELGRNWEAVLPPGAVLARLSGDEFAVVAPGVDVPRAHELATELVRTLQEVGANSDWHLGVSIGIAARTDDTGAEELLRRADAAMYLVKTACGGIGVYDDAVDRTERDRVELTEDLVDALTSVRRATEFVLHYQPQVDACSGRLVGAEALVRWQHPRRGLLYPGDFLDLVESRRLMPLLTEQVLRTALAQQREWLAGGLDVRLSVNLSASCLEHPELIPLLEEHAPPGRLVIEVTETSLMVDPDVALATCHEIVRRGFDLSIDDYGTGYSSMSYLAVLPATELKVDKSFVQRIEEPRMRSIVAATVELARALGMRVVAEGVETPGHLAAVQELGCDESQGYLHARPLPAAELLRWSRERDGQSSVAVSMTNR